MGMNDTAPNKADTSFNLNLTEVFLFTKKILKPKTLKILLLQMK